MRSMGRLPSAREEARQLKSMMSGALESFSVIPIERPSDLSIDIIASACDGQLLHWDAMAAPLVFAY